MWETPFDPEMLDGSVLIHCPSEELASELMGLLSECGVRWDVGGCPVSAKDIHHWSFRGEDTCYRISSKYLSYSSKQYYENEEAYSYYKRCTFFGADTPDFDTANDDEVMALFGVGG